MSNKTLTFDDNILDILKVLEWADDGLSVKILQQLERPTYLKVNKALESIGGKWNRTSKAHLFKEDPREQVKGLLSSGTLTIKKDGFFETPAHIVNLMVEKLPFEPFHYILEPSAGLGAIIKILLENDAQKNHILAIEKNNKRATSLQKAFPGISVSVCDFTTEYQGYMKFRYDRIYMNPPFEQLQDIDHVKQAYKCLKDGGKMVSIMSPGFSFRSDKKAVDFREWLQSVNAYIEKLPENSFKESGAGINTVMIIIEKQYHEL